jgi:uncharacterized protein YbcC (UPF0753/DUF2309 family)
MALAQPVLQGTAASSTAEIAALVSLASRVVPPLWPLESAIAVNPLAGLEEQDFAAALRTAGRLFDFSPRIPLQQWRALVEAGRIDHRVLRKVAAAWLGGLTAETIRLSGTISALDLLMARLMELPDPAFDSRPVRPLSPAAAFIAKWCAAYCDDGAALAMPGRELGLYGAVLRAAEADPEFRALAGPGWRDLLAGVEREPLAAIASGLTALGISGRQSLDYLNSRVARLPGWSGHLRWRTEHADGLAPDMPASMADLLALWVLLDRATGTAWPEADDKAPAGGAMRAMLEKCLAESGGRPWGAEESWAFEKIARLSSVDLTLTFMAAAEETYYEGLVPRLAQAMRRPSAVGGRPAAQLLFCIDVRSEPFRRALEQQGRYETLGYAGFFGLPIAVHSPDHGQRLRQLPVLIAPQHDLVLAPVPGKMASAEQELRKHKRAEATRGAFSMVKAGAATAFATAEVTGPLAALVMLARTFAPRAAERIGRRLGGRLDSVLAPALASGDHHPHGATLTLEERATYAKALFRLTGLSASTARLVVLVGHGGSAVNNPYAAALDCGACGGHAGGPNARVMAAILNDRAVRARLADAGIDLPEDTVFVAAQHNTTTDEMEIFDHHLVPATHQGELLALIDDLNASGQANRERRAGLLACDAADLLSRGAHWGEIRPEWGLAGNAAFIVGARSLTKGLDLEGRAFLHSYDWETDETGEALATILTAPMVVAQWISCQYLFSTLDNERFGSGDKTTQNAVCRIGVVQGNGGDLRIGLPRQSLFTDDGMPFHVPQRLLTVVHAPFERVRRIIDSHDILARLFGKGWVSLVILDPVTGLTLRWRPDRELLLPPLHGQPVAVESLSMEVA